MKILIFLHAVTNFLKKNRHYKYVLHFFWSLNTKKLPQLRQVMNISDIKIKMREKLSVWKNSFDYIGLVEIFSWCIGPLIVSSTLFKFLYKGWPYKFLCIYFDVKSGRILSLDYLTEKIFLSNKNITTFKVDLQIPLCIFCIVFRAHELFLFIF